LLQGLPNLRACETTDRRSEHDVGGVAMRLISILALFGLLAFGGCATVVDVPLAGGGVGHAISCDDPAPGWSVCTRSAEQTCPAKQYRVINQAEQPDTKYIPATAASVYKIGGTIIKAPAQPASESTIIRRTMVISCS
jgi:hypothetical protein